MGIRPFRHAFLLAAGATLALAQQQQPSYQPGWPCTGKARSFDPAYAKIAEATGGHLFLFDKSEVTGMSTLAIGDMNHKQTIARAAGKIDSYVDIPFWVDSSVESLFVVASLQCMQTIYLYDPQRSSVAANQYTLPQTAPETKPGEDAWFKAGRITMLPRPQPGQWVLRLLGTGPYFVAIQAKSQAGLGAVQAEKASISVWLDTARGASGPRPKAEFGFVNAAGEPLGKIPLVSADDSPTHYIAQVPLPGQEFRIQAQWTTPTGERVQRTDPRLTEPKP